MILSIEPLAGRIAAQVHAAPDKGVLVHEIAGIGSQRRGARCRVRFLIPLSSPCVRFSRTRLSDDLLGMAYAIPG